MYLQQHHKVWIATGETPIYLEPSMANRHGLIAGATGTGKTVTLKVLAESFSDMGVPVFLADIKGDLSGMCQMGKETKHIRRSIDNMNIQGFDYTAYPLLGRVRQAGSACAYHHFPDGTGSSVPSAGPE